MKKSQRLRLAELKGKATTTDAEKAEITQLEALASKHPDTAQDIDDTQAAAAKPITAADFFAKMTAAFSAKAALAQQNSELSSRISALETELATATAAKSTAETATAAANTAKVEAEGKLAIAVASLATLASALGVKPEELAGKDSAAVQTLFDGRLAEAATSKLAALGFPESGLPPQNKADGGTATKSELIAQYNSITDPVKRGEFYQKNFSAMFTGGKN